jgi:hypothetical protein
MTEYEMMLWSPEGDVTDLDAMSGSKRKKRKARRKERKAKRKEKRATRKAKRKAKKKGRKARRKARRMERRNRRQTRKTERRARKKGVGRAAGEGREITELAESYAEAADTDLVANTGTASAGNKTLLIGGVLAVAAAGAYWYFQNR